MKIFISTGIYPPDIGGPANYAKQLNIELKNLGHKLEVASYRLEKKLPIVVRHLYYFFKIIPKVIRSEWILILDTFSVGFPTFLLAKIFRKKIILRTGGDFVWESYVERTENKILLSEFYIKLPNDLSLKEKFLFWWIKRLLNGLDGVIFSTKFQRDIFIHGYNLNFNNVFIIENYYGLSEYKKEKIEYISGDKIYLWAGRDIILKNVKLLKRAFDEAKKEDPSIKLEISEHVTREDLLDKINKSYCVIHPSLSETSSNFILESIMIKKPFITTIDIGLYDRIKDLGVFINPKNETDIKEKILFVSKSENYIKLKNKLNNFNFVHTYEEIAKEFVVVFKKV